MKKDTVIAVIVPLLLILSLFYNRDGIAGYAVAEPKKALGTYFLDPSFSISFNYQMQKEYDDAAQKAKNAVEKCKNEKKIGDCLNNEIKNKGYKCEKNELEDIFYDFIGKYRECLSLEQNDVICRFSLEKINVDAKLKKLLRLEMGDDGDNINFELKDGDNVLIEDFMALPGMQYISDFNERSKAPTTNSISIELDYTSIPKIKGIRSRDGRAFSESVLYKSNGKVMFVEKGIESSFRTLNPVNLPRRKGAKFCIKSNAKVAAMDTGDEVKERNVLYRFAVIYPEIDIPPPVKNFDANDKLKAENSIIINWTKAVWDDGSDILNLDHYRVYCSDKEFEKNDKDELKLDGLKPVMAFSDGSYDEWKIEIDKCSGKNIMENKQYYFTITAATKEAESPAVLSKAGSSADDLSPGIVDFKLKNSKGEASSQDAAACIDLIGSIQAVPAKQEYRPEYNEDKDKNNPGTRVRADEKLEYLLHYSKSKVAADIGACEPYKCRKIADKAAVSFDANSDIDAQNNKFAEGQNYCLALVAKDEKGNMMKQIGSPYEFTKPEQWDGLENFRKT